MPSQKPFITHLNYNQADFDRHVSQTRRRKAESTPCHNRDIIGDLLCAQGHLNTEGEILTEGLQLIPYPSQEELQMFNFKSAPLENLKDNPAYFSLFIGQLPQAFSAEMIIWLFEVALCLPNSVIFCNKRTGKDHGFIAINEVNSEIFLRFCKSVWPTSTGIWVAHNNNTRMIFERLRELIFHDKSLSPFASNPIVIERTRAPKFQNRHNELHTLLAHYQAFHASFCQLLPFNDNTLALLYHSESVMTHLVAALNQQEQAIVQQPQYEESTPEPTRSRLRQ